MKNILFLSNSLAKGCTDRLKILLFVLFIVVPFGNTAKAVTLQFSYLQTHIQKPISETHTHPDINCEVQNEI